MHTIIKAGLALLFTIHAVISMAQEQVVDLPTRAGVFQRMLVLTPPEPRGAVILIAGGHGGLQISADGTIKWGKENFVVRSRQLFADRGLLVVVVDAPSDRQSPPFLAGNRQKPEHVADIKAVIAWIRTKTKTPVWLVGTSRGTQSAAFIATELQAPDGPDGMVLTSTILIDHEGRSVPAMSLEKLRIPVLVVHHTQDGCKHCPYSDTSVLMDKLTGTTSKQLLSIRGGENTGDPCNALSYHGYNGLDREVIDQIASWMLARR